MPYKKRVAGAVNTVNGKSGDIKMRDALFLSKTFTQTHLAGTSLTLGTLPANARVVSVSLTSRNFDFEQIEFQSLYFTVGHTATIYYPEDQEAFLSQADLINVVAPTPIKLIVPGFADFIKDANLPVTLFFLADSPFTGQTLNITIEYIQE